MKIEKITPPPVQPEPVIVLTLSLDEAKSVRTVLGYVAGPSGGRRAHTEAIYRQLGDLKVGGADDEFDQVKFNFR